MILKEANSESSFSFGFGNGCIEGKELKVGIKDSAALGAVVTEATEVGIDGGDSHCVEGGGGPKLSLPLA